MIFILAPCFYLILRLYSCSLFFLAPRFRVARCFLKYIMYTFNFYLERYFYFCYVFLLWWGSGVSKFFLPDFLSKDIKFAKSYRRSEDYSRLPCFYGVFIFCFVFLIFAALVFALFYMIVFCFSFASFLLFEYLKFIISAREFYIWNWVKLIN